jgi:hypothetical protein
MQDQSVRVTTNGRLSRPYDKTSIRWCPGYAYLYFGRGRGLYDVAHVWSLVANVFLIHVLTLLRGRAIFGTKPYSISTHAVQWHFNSSI